MKVLDLFSGIGGFSLGLERAGMETVAFCEIDPFCQKVLRKHWPDVPIYDDVRTLDYDGSVDLICGGYPCQPFSSAGKRKGAEDDRHLWPAMFSLIKKHRPAWVIGENVAGHISMGLDNVLSDLEGEGYAATPFVIPACAVGAKHRRDRVWIIAHSMCGRKGNSQTLYKPSLDEERNSEAQSKRQKPVTSEVGRDDAILCCENVCYAASARFPDWSGGEMGQPRPITEFERPDGREIERDFRGVAHGVSSRVDRLRALGNAVVPQIPEIIGKAIMEAEYAVS